MGAFRFLIRFCFHLLISSGFGDGAADLAGVAAGDGPYASSSVRCLRAAASCCSLLFARVFARFLLGFLLGFFLVDAWWNAS